MAAPERPPLSRQREGALRVSPFPITNFQRFPSTMKGAAMTHRQMFANLPVKDLKRSVDFFSKLGFTFDPKFTNDDATCMIVGDNIFVMLLEEQFFQTFTPNPVCDAKTATEVLMGFSCESRTQVDELVRKALAAGGSAPTAPQDYGFMYGHEFVDPDGHIWEPFYLKPGVAPG
jgi:predicted lactoylglutathione lyase